MTVTGTVIEALPDTNFRVKLDEEDREILAYLAGKMRVRRIRILPGDSVKVELPSEDAERGRITWRL